MKIVLTIGGSDSFGGAGIQADMKAITSLEAHALTVVTAVTAQNSLAVTAIFPMPGTFISKQLKAIFEDVVPDALKIGMLYSRDAVTVVASWLRKHRSVPAVLDPLMKASTGRRLLRREALAALRNELIPLVSIITPNLWEAEVLSRRKVKNYEDMADAAREIQRLGPDVVLTGGHLEKECMDLFFDGNTFHEFRGPKIQTPHTHGSGCVFSAALATYLAKGNERARAVGLAREFTRNAIFEGYACGHGHGPLGIPHLESWGKWRAS